VPMTNFTIHTAESAPEGSKPLLETSQKSFGMIPNLHGVFAESPQVLEAYQTLTRLFAESSLDTEARHVVWLTINVLNRCRYCVPAHTLLARNDKVRDEVIDAVREERPIPDARLEALRQFTISVVENRGFVDNREVEAFLAAGFTKQNVLDVLLGVSHKVLSNYANHLAETPVDAPFAQFHWTPAGKDAAE
jgi:AhpD family alkylhydroperoxidase